MGSRRTEGKRSSSCIWWERAPFQIVVWCVMARFRCQGRSSQSRGTWAATWGKRHPSLTSSTRSVSCGTRAGCRGHKRCFFIGRVVNTALSEIEAFCPSEAQYQSLTSLVTCLARRVMAGAAARRGEHGRVRTTTNKESLRFWKLAPCDVEAQVRRLKWAQTLVQDPRTMRN